MVGHVCLRRKSALHRPAQPCTLRRSGHLTELPVKYQTFLTTCDTTKKRIFRGWKMKWPKSEEFSGTVNCSHLGVELAPLKIAYAEPDSPSAERTALRRAAPLLEKNPVLPDLQLERLRVGKRLRGSSLGDPLIRPWRTRFFKYNALKVPGR